MPKTPLPIQLEIDYHKESRNFPSRWDLCHEEIVYASFYDEDFMEQVIQFLEFKGHRVERNKS